MKDQRSTLSFDFASYLDAGRVRLLSAETDKPTALRGLAELISRERNVRLPEEFIHAIFERERVSSTGVGRGIAIPHARLDSVTDFVVSVGISQIGIDYDAKDGNPVHVIVMFASSEKERSRHLLMLAAITARLKDDEVYRRLLVVRDPGEVVRILGGR